MFSYSWYNTFTIKNLSTVHTSTGIYVSDAMVILFSECFCKELLRHFYCKQIFTGNLENDKKAEISYSEKEGYCPCTFRFHLLCILLYIIWTLHFVGHECVFHGHILRQCWSLWRRQPVLCNPAPPSISLTAQYFVFWSAMSLHCCQTVNPCYVL